jgi:DNA-binding IscR family transcriptional regulator
MQPDDGEISRRQVSQAMEVPLHFLGKIAQQLSHAGIIQITKGAKGRLPLGQTRQAHKLAGGGGGGGSPLGLNLCLIHEESCDRSGFCPVHEVWQEAQAGLQKTLAKADLATLAAEEKTAAISNFLSV